MGRIVAVQGRTSRCRRYLATRGLLLSSAALIVIADPLAGHAQQATSLPASGSVVSGAAAISSPSATSVLITQTSRNAIINWGSFSVGAGHAVRFENGAGATLNRVTGFSPSQIDGSLSASGSVYLVNPNGITVGPNGQVTTGGSFIASTHDVSDAAFNAGGAMTFKGSSTASVINYGSIGSLGGDVALIARKVENAGTITAPSGTVGLAAGYEVLVRDTALSDGKFVVKVGGGDTEAKTSGVIKAAEAELKANGGNVYALAGNTNSITKATGIASKGGRIFLTAGDGGSVQVTQKVSARAAASNGKAKGGEIRVSGGTVKVSGGLDATGEGDAGGTIVVTARDIALAAGADLDASGTTGGRVLVGGDYQGGKDASTKYLAEDVATAATTTVDAGASLHADGATGAGGKIVVWSNETTHFAGAITATGGGAGAGGDVEISGKARLGFDGTVDTHSESGVFGNLLLDPYNLTISNAASSGMSGFSAGANDSVLNVTALETALLASNVTVQTGSGGTQAGNITVADSIGWFTNTVLTLNAAGSIVINADIFADGTTGGLSLVYGTGYSLNNGARVNLSGSGASLTIGGTSYTVIQDLAGLQAMGPDGHYALGRDLDASATAGWNGGTGFSPIGAVGAAFSGTFTGLGHVIDGLTVNRPSTDFIGLFGLASSATVRDVTLSNASMTGADYVGGIVGQASSSTFSNIHVTGSVSGRGGAGGIAGLLRYSSLSNASSGAAVTALSFVAGGLVGDVFNTATISDSYATGPVTAAGYVGALVGQTTDGVVTLSRVYASGRVTGTIAGGLIGADNDAYPSSITLNNAYWDANSTGQTRAIGSSLFSSITGTATNVAAAPRTQTTYAGLDFANTWVMIDGETRPMLRSEQSSVIATPAALQLMALNLSDSYELGANIDLASALAVGSNGYYGGLWGASGFMPVGSVTSSFTGEFNGRGHTISGLTITRGGSDNVGLFGYTNGATVINVALAGGSITGNENVGPLIGTMEGGIAGSVSSSTTVSSGSTVTSNAGGLIGYVLNGTVQYAFATGDVTASGTNVGGLVGYLLGTGIITRSYATGNVTGTGITTSYVGGLVGSARNVGTSGNISQSFATGTVTGSAGPIGGFVGFNDSTITDSYASGRVIGLGSASNVGGFVGLNFTTGTITSAYATGYVTGFANVGGFAGNNSGASSAFTSVYWDVQTTGQASGIAAGTGSATPKNTIELQGSLPAGFSSSIWSTGTHLYPYFWWRYNTTPIAISGVAYSDAGTTALAGTTVTAVSGGSGIGSAVTGANGYYYILGPASSLAASGVLAYLDDGATMGAAFSDVAGTNGVQDVAIYGTAAHVLTEQSTLTATQTNYLATRGSYADTDLSFLSSSTFAPLTTTAGYGVHLDTTGNYTLNGNLGSAGLLSIDSGGTFGVSGAITLSAAGALTVADAVSWSDASSLSLSTTSGGNINLGGAVTGSNGTLAVSVGGTATTSSAVNVGTFNLSGGTWSQIAATLPSFGATNFVIGSGTTFLRVAGGDGTVATPYQIADLYGLQGIGSASLLSQNFVLTADINATPSAIWNASGGFAPIGSSTTSFTGTLDGAGHTIGGLTIQRPTGASGLFGYIGVGGSVSNLTVAGAVTGVNAGMIAAFNSGTVTNVTTYGSVGNTGASTPGSIGGAVGQNSGIITDSTSAAAVSAAGVNGSYAGGLVGYNDFSTSLIANSSASGTVSAATSVGSSAGGLAGLNAGIIRGSYATGNVVSGYYSGGLVGNNNGGNVSKSLATGSVSGFYQGGLLGFLSGTITDTYATGSVLGSDGYYSGGLVGYSDGTINSSYSTGAVSTGVYVGGLVGYNSFGTINNSFWNTTTSGNALGVAGGPVSGATGLTTTQMMSLSTFTNVGWSIDDAGGTSSVWRIYDGYTMPLLRSFMSSLTVTGGSGSKTYDGSATSGDVGTLVYSPGGADTSLVAGTAGYMASSANAGTYSGAGLRLAGLYSSQFGYDITFVSGTLLIDKAGLTVTASDAAKTYDGLAYSGGNGVTYSGFVGFDTAASLGGTLTYGGTSQGALNAGTYSLTAGGLSSGNYNISYAAGTLTVGTAALTVTANDGTKTYDGTAYSGGNGVTYSGLMGSDTAASLGGTLAYGGTAQGAVNAGSYSLTASGLTSGNYAISYVPGTLTVSPAALTVTANAASKVYDATAYSGGNGVTYSGFAGSDSAASLGGTLAYGGTSQGAVNAGSYAITASGLTSSNYAISYVPAMLTVSPAALTVAANAQSMLYGDAVAALTYAITHGTLYGSDVLSGALATAASSATAVGSYAITQGTLGNPNYAISYTAANLTVTARPITVEANVTSMTYGDALPALIYAVGGAGLVNGDTLTGALVTGATSASSVGTYAIAQGTLAASTNYTLTYVPGTVVVGARPLTVAANNQSRLFGAANPVFTYTVGGRGLVNSDGLTGALVSDADSTSTAGRYLILQGTLAASANYALTYVPGTLTVVGTSQNTNFVETSVPDQVVETLDTRSLISFIERPSRPIEQNAAPQVTSCGGTSSGGQCAFLPVSANLPSGPWLRFVGQ